MKKLDVRNYFCFFLLFLIQPAAWAADNLPVHLIPQPVSLVEQHGQFLFDHSVPLIINTPGQELNETANWFVNQLTTTTGVTIQQRKSGKNGIHLSLITSGDKNIIGKEGYILSVSPTSVSLKANTVAGIFYGMQTLLQLFPADARTIFAGEQKRLGIPCLVITDYPRFAWRGIMLDVSRHFFTKEEVEKFIDEIVMFKYNVLHLHLSDDQGWRIEIKSLPQLTKEGAWRVKRTGQWGQFLPALANEPATDGPPGRDRCACSQSRVDFRLSQSFVYSTAI